MNHRNGNAAGLPVRAAPLPRARLQRKCACVAPGQSCGRCSAEKKLLQRKAAQGGSFAIPGVVRDVLDSPGHPLDSGTREFMESRFNADFSQVRIHADHRAAQSSVAVNALAYTVGSEIVFGAGQWTPESTKGRQLLAHELAHVVQQRAGALESNDTAAEAEADHIADRIESGSVPAVRHGLSGELHRKEPTEDELKKMQAAGNQCAAGNCHAPPPPAKDLKSFGPSGDAAVRAWAASPPAPPTSQSGRADNAHATSKSESLKQFATPSKEEMANLRDYAAAVPGIEAREAAKKNAEFRQGLAAGHATGSIYLDPNLDQPAAEKKLRQQHAQLKLLAPDLAESLERDPGYMKAMGTFAETAPAPAAAIPGATPGVAAPLTMTLDGKPLFDDTSSAYWKTPRGHARLALKREIEVTRNALDALYGERRDIVDSSVVIRKVSESMVGIEPPPISRLNECRALLDDALQKLTHDELEQAAKLHGSASRLRREAAWYWARYKEFLFQGAERTVEGLEMVRDTSKYSLMVLSMAATGGAAAPLWIGIGGGAAIEFAEAGTKSALGEKVDWTKVVVETAVQVALAKFGGRFTQGLIGKLSTQPAFAGLDKSLIGGAIKGVMNGMEARLVTSAVGSTMKGDTWGQTVDNLVAGLADWKLLIDLVLGAAHASRAKRTGTSAAEGAGGKGKQAVGGVELEPAGAPKSVNPEQATARKKTVGGHDAVVTREGVGICSPPPCPVINIVYARELAASPELRNAYRQVQAARNTNPQRAAELSDTLIRNLETFRANAAVQLAPPTFATPVQRVRLNAAIERAQQLSETGSLNRQALNEHLQTATSPAELEEMIGQIEKQVARKLEIKRDVGKTEQRTGDIEGTDATGTTTKPRTRAVSHERALGRGMEAEGGAIPLDHDRHHVAPKSGGGEVGERIRELLRLSSVSVDDPSNGIPLAGQARDPRAIHESDLAHARAHTSKAPESNWKLLLQDLETVRGDADGTRAMLRKHGQRLFENRERTAQEFRLGPDFEPED